MSISLTMNEQTAIRNKLLTLISKNGGVHVGRVDDLPASPAPTHELDFNQSTTDNH